MSVVSPLSSASIRGRLGVLQLVEDLLGSDAAAIRCAAVTAVRPVAAGSEAAAVRPAAGSAGVAAVRPAAGSAAVAAVQ